MEQKHSRLGIASFVISIMAGISMYTVIVVAAVLEILSPGILGGDSVSTAIVGLVIIVMLFASLLALGLGIAGTVRKNHKKIFAVLGMIFSAVSCLGTSFIFLVGVSLV